MWMRVWIRRGVSSGLHAISVVKRWGTGAKWYNNMGSDGK